MSQYKSRVGYVMHQNMFIIIEKTGRTTNVTIQVLDTIYVTRFYVE